MRSWDALENLLGAYLHQDYASEYGTAWAAIEKFAEREPDHSPEVGADIDEIVDLCESDPQLEQCLIALGLDYDPPADGWTDHRTWLLAIRDRVDEIVRGLPPEPATD